MQLNARKVGTNESMELLLGACYRVNCLGYCAKSREALRFVSVGLLLRSVLMVHGLILAGGAEGALPWPSFRLLPFHVQTSVWLVGSALVTFGNANCVVPRIVVLMTHQGSSLVDVATQFVGSRILFDCKCSDQRCNQCTLSAHLFYKFVFMRSPSAVPGPYWSCCDGLIYLGWVSWQISFMLWRSWMSLSNSSHIMSVS